MSKFFRSIPPLALLFVPALASAHEVYVLSSSEIAEGIATPPFNMVAVALQDIGSFAFWGFITALAIFIVFGISIVRPVERFCSPFLMRIKPYAFAVARVTVGIGLICGSYFQATFGPELPLLSSYGPYTHLATLALSIVGTLILTGLWARAAALVALAMYLFGVYLHGAYMLTYLNYLGEFIVLLIVGSHRASVHSLLHWSERFHRSYHVIVDRMSDLAFPILRATFGISLIYASAYAKIFHNDLALQVASLPLAGHAYPVAHYLGFEPHFLVLGAAIIEIIIGLFFIFGIEIRFTSLFLLVWLSLSLWYFGESVWPHIILIGIPIALIMHGYDRYSLEGRFFKKGRREPVL
jgi:uncharacterized membrane protein YphA (DoxX/SURF4 family)